MAQKKTISESLIKSAIGAFVFSLFFVVSSLVVSICFPIEDSEKKELAYGGKAPEKEEKEISLDNFVVEVDFSEEKEDSAVAKAMQYAVIDFSKQEDEGLKFYRNPEFKNSVTWFYNQITGKEDVTEAILTYADENNIPLSLAFALAYSESNYVVKAVNKNTNHSIDRGLFQLNNNSFPNLKEEDFFDPYVSAKYGLAHLRFCLDTAGNEVAALAMYNAGTRRVKSGETPQITLNYVSKIINYKNGLDDLFDFQSSTWLNSSLFEAIALGK